MTGSARYEQNQAALHGKGRGSYLELDHISLTYQAGTPFETPALRDISLRVNAGERLAIAGPVGSGKSSLLGVLAGVEPPRPAGSSMKAGRSPAAGSRPREASASHFSPPRTASLKSRSWMMSLFRRGGSV